MFRFGWLTVTSEDLAVWEQFPTAALIRDDFWNLIDRHALKRLVARSP
jgi:hypothetical protein